MQPEVWQACQTVLVIIGGHGQGLLPYLMQIYPFLSYVLFIDAFKEINGLDKAHLKPRMRLFSLGVGKTGQMLCNKLPANLLNHVKSIGSMSAAGGLGQCILMGRLAGQELADSHDFQDFVSGVLIPEMRNRAGGALAEIRYAFLGSSAGAAFTGAERPVAGRLVQTALDQTEAIVTSAFLVTGPLTYETLGERVLTNGGAATAELVAHVIDPNRHEREVRTLRCIDFPMCDVDEGRRDAVLAQVEQAAHSHARQYDLEREAPNSAFNGRYGNIQTWEAAFGTPLDDRADIAACVRAAYVPQLQAVLGREASLAAAERLEIDHARVTLANADVDDVVDAAIARPVEQSIQELESPSFRHNAEVKARLSPTRTESVNSLMTEWATAATTLDGLDSCIQLQRRLVTLLKEEEAQLAHRDLEITEDATRSRDDFLKYHGLLTPQGLFQLLRGALTSAPKKLIRLRTAAQRLRQATDARVEWDAERAAVSQALAFTNADLEYSEAKLERIVTRLIEAGAPLGDSAPTVEVQPIDRRLAELWNAVDETIPPALARARHVKPFAAAVRGSAAEVTLHGLAKVTRAAAPRIDEIARQIALGGFIKTPGVPWGGRLRADDGKVVCVLPPVAAELRAPLCDAVAAMNDRLIVEFMDAAPAVVNVVQLTMRLVQRLTDVLPAPLFRALTKVAFDPYMEKWLPDGEKTLTQLAITRQGSELLLPNED